MTNKEAKIILDKVEELGLEEHYSNIGIRVQDVPFTLGAIDHVSYTWIDGDYDPDSEPLNGVCASLARLDALTCNCYWGEHVAILVSESADIGDDYGEIVMQDAEVVYIFY